MSVNIRFNVQKAAAQAQAQAMGQQLGAQKTKWNKFMDHVKTNYTYYSQLGNILLSNLVKLHEGTAALSGFQATQAAYSAVMGEIAVVLTAKQALAAFASPLPGMRAAGTALTIISLSLQASVAAALSQQLVAIQLQSQAAEIARQLEAYNV